MDEIQRMDTRIYIAGPYTNGGVAVNLRTVYEYADRLAERGFAPYVPHATHFWHIISPHPYEFWLQLDECYLECCHGLLRIPGPSKGADQEVEFAHHHDIPVFTEIEDLVEYFRDRP